MYCCAFLASKPWKKRKPNRTPPICTAVCLLFVRLAGLAPPHYDGPHIAQYPFKTASQSVSHAFCLVFIWYRVSTLRYLLHRGYHTSSAHARAMGYWTQGSQAPPRASGNSQNFPEISPNLPEVPSGCRNRGVEFKGGSRHDRNRHNRRNRQNRPNRHGCLLVLYFVGQAKGRQGAFPEPPKPSKPPKPS